MALLKRANNCFHEALLTPLGVPGILGMSSGVIVIMESRGVSTSPACVCWAHCITGNRSTVQLQHSTESL